MFKLTATMNLQILIALTILAVIPCTIAELSEWSIPNPKIIAKAEEFCQNVLPEMENTTISDARITDEATAEDLTVRRYLKCMMSELGLWIEYKGFSANRVAKLFAKYKLIEEVMLVVNHCTEKYQSYNHDKWLMEAYRCATSGTIGNWANDLLKEYNRKKKQLS